MKAGRGSVDLLVAVFGVVALFTLAFGRGWDRVAGSRGSGRVPLRLAYFPNLTHAPALIGVVRGTFEQELPSYEVTAKVVNAGPEAMEALLAGDVDIAYVGPSPAMNTYLKTKGQALEIVAGACSGGASLVAREDLNISSVAELDGHSVAVPQLGGTQDVSCRNFLAREGLAPKEDGGTVAIIPVNNPDVLTLFKRRQIDAAWVPEPWASRLRSEAHAKLVVDERQLWPAGSFTTTVVVVRKGFAETHPDAVRAFVKAHADTVSWIQAHPSDARKVVNDELNRLTGKPLDESVLLGAWGRLDFTTEPNQASIAAFAEAAYTAHYLKIPPTGLAGIVDPAPLAALGAAKSKDTR